MSESFWNLAGFSRKLLFSRKRDKGRGSFVFRRPRIGPQRIAIELASRRNGQRAALQLRRHGSDRETFEQVFWEQDYAMREFARWPDIEACYAAACELGEPLILDLGANIGLASAWFALEWPAARIVAVEPEPANFRQLQHNLAPHGRTVHLQAAIGPEAGEVRIANPEAEAWAIRTTLEPGAAGPAVPMVTVEQALERAQAVAGERPVVPFICKIDIEGFERELFSVDTPWFDAFPIVIVELHDWLLPGQGTSAPFLKRLTQGPARDLVQRGENLFVLSPVLGTPAAARVWPRAALRQ